MKALVYHGPREMHWEDWPEPELGPGEALVAVRAVGICGSDLHGYTGESGRRKPPMIMGHEATGEVVALGPAAPGPAVGSRVVVQPILACGACDQCQAGCPNRCRGRRFVGGNANGAMAERMAVPAGNLLALPEALSNVHATLVEPLAVALHAAQRAGDLAGRSVLIAGSGPIGLLTLVAARERGAHPIVMTDVVSRRRAAALALGADAALDPAAQEWRQELAGAVGAEEVDVAFDAVGVATTFQQALEAARPGGTVVSMGGWRSLPLDLSRLVARELQLRGTFNFTPGQFVEACASLSAGQPDPHALVTHVHPLAEGADIFAALAAQPAEAIKVVLTLGEEVAP